MQGLISLTTNGSNFQSIGYSSNRYAQLLRRACVKPEYGDVRLPYVKIVCILSGDRGLSACNELDTLYRADPRDIPDPNKAVKRSTMMGLGIFG